MKIKKLNETKNKIQILKTIIYDNWSTRFSSAFTNLDFKITPPRYLFAIDVFEFPDHPEVSGTSSQLEGLLRGSATNCCRPLDLETIRWVIQGCPPADVGTETSLLPVVQSRCSWETIWKIKIKIKKIFEKESSYSSNVVSLFDFPIQRPI